MAYEIPIDVGTLDKMIDRLEKAATLSDKLTGKVASLNNELRNSGSSSMAPKVAGGAQSTFQRKFDSIYNNTAGPFTRVQLADQRLMDARSAGFAASSPEMKNAVYAQMVAQKSEARAQKVLDGGPSRLDLIKQAVMSSRFGADGLMPLVGRTMAALGEGGAAGLGIGYAAYKLGEYGEAQQGKAFNIYSRTGGSPTEVARLRAMGDDAGERALAFGDRLNQGGVASGYFRSRGIIDRGPYQVNKATNYLNAIDALRNERDESTAIRIARESGLSNELKYRYMDKGIYNRLSQTTSQAGTPEAIRNWANFEGRKEEANNALQRVGDNIGDYINRRIKSVSDNPFELLGPIGAVGAVGDIIDMITGRDTKAGKAKSMSDQKNNTGSSQRVFRDEMIGGGINAHAGANLGEVLGTMTSRNLSDSMRIGAFIPY